MEHPLTTYRKNHDLTLQALAEVFGVTKGMLSKWESCKALPRRNSLWMIERKTDGAVTVADMVNAYSALLIPEAAE